MIYSGIQTVKCLLETSYPCFFISFGAVLAEGVWTSTQMTRADTPLSGNFRSIRLYTVFLLNYFRKQ